MPASFCPCPEFTCAGHARADYRSGLAEYEPAGRRRPTEYRHVESFSVSQSMPIRAMPEGLSTAAIFHLRQFRGDGAYRLIARFTGRLLASAVARFSTREPRH